jgi:DNA repair exonuclease SbcCD nuclease subunit
MTNFLHLADLHLTSTSDNWGEQQTVMAWLLSQVQERSPDGVLIAGDLTNKQPRRATIEERRVLARWCAQAAMVCPVTVIRGNHDLRNDWGFLSHLPGVRYFEKPGRVTVDDTEIFCLPYPRRSAFADVGVSKVGISEELKQAVVELLRAVGLSWKSSKRILLGHLNISGSLLSNGQPFVGDDVEVTLAQLEVARASYYALGHIHQPQDLGQARYPGSLWPSDFGEEHEHSVSWVTIDDDGAHVETVESIARPVCTISAIFSEGELRPEDKHVPERARVKLRVEVSEEEAALLSEERASLVFGHAVDVFEKRVVKSHRVRAPKIAETKDLREKLKLYWEVASEPPTEDVQAMALERLSAIIEGENNEAKISKAV